MVKPSIRSFRNIIFDLGGVILNLSVPATLQAFASKSQKTVEQISAHLSAPEFLAYEKGQISDSDFRAAVRGRLGTSLTDQDIDNCWNAMLGDLPMAGINLLTSLRKTHQTFLLSNTNAIHLSRFASIVRYANIDNFDALFTRAYYSHLIGMRKPDTEIFQHVLQQNNLRANETVFLDDNEVNLRGAASVGIHTIHIENPAMTVALFHE